MHVLHVDKYTVHTADNTTNTTTTTNEQKTNHVVVADSTLIKGQSPVEEDILHALLSPQESRHSTNFSRKSRAIRALLGMIILT